MTMSDLDPRLHAYRDDLADVRLEGKVSARRFISGEPLWVKTHFADVHAKPDSQSGINTQALFGDEVRVFDVQSGWAWVQLVDDGYVGYIRHELLGAGGSTPTHMVLAPRTFLYSKSDLKSPRSGYLSMGSKIVVTDSITTRDTDYYVLENGASLIAGHVIEIGNWQEDYVTVAETLLHTPYLWGGNTGFGIDCSGLLSLSHRLCGKMVLRDSDMQAASVGDEAFADDSYGNLQRGDLVFWDGHVAIMSDNKMMLHANGNTMNVAHELLSEAIERIAYLYGKPTLVRRP